jgi:hypothetical protein
MQLKRKNTLTPVDKIAKNLEKESSLNGSEKSKVLVHSFTMTQMKNDKNQPTE